MSSINSDFKIYDVISNLSLLNKYNLLAVADRLQHEIDMFALEHTYSHDFHAYIPLLLI